MTAMARSQVKALSTSDLAVVPALNPSFQSSLEVITPAVATKMLESNTSNRRLSRKTVNGYAADMVADRWCYNGQDILFAEDGTLLDGQHRLAAIVAAGVPVQIGVKRGLPRGVFDTIDAGKARTASDILGLLGLSYTTHSAAVARMSLAYASGRPMGVPSATRNEVTDYVQAHPYIEDAIKMAFAVHARMPVAPVASVLFLANQRRFFDAQVSEFMDGVINGVALEKGDPRLTLREWAVSERLRSRGKLRGTVTFAATARAWTAFIRNERLKVIKVSKDLSKGAIEIVGFYDGAAA